MRLGPLEQKYVYVGLDAHLADGSPAVVESVEVAVLPLNSRTGPATAWRGVTVAEGQVRVLLAGSDADADADALTASPPGVDLWVRIVDHPEVEVYRAAQIVVSSY